MTHVNLTRVDIFDNSGIPERRPFGMHSNGTVVMATGTCSYSHVVQKFELEILTVHEREVRSNHADMEFEFGILTVGMPDCHGRRERNTSSEGMISQWILQHFR
jgi:hypothetical protein